MRRILTTLIVLILSFVVVSCSQTEKFTLKFNSNGGEYIESIVVKGDQSNVNVPTPTKEGYTFAGWYIDNNFKVAWDGNVSKDLTLYAKWEVNSYTLSYVTNCDELFDNIVLSYNDNIPTDKIPYKEGYTFVGWYLDKELTTPNNLFKMPANDVTLYAKYEANRCQVKFIVDDIAIKTINVDFDSTINLEDIPTNVTKKGYTHVGWEVDGVEYDFNSAVKGTMKIVAKFEVNTYNLKFNVEGVETVVQYTYGAALNPIKNPENITGHTFEGWMVLNSITNEYEPFSFTNATMPDYDIELYAKWSVNKYNIDFVLNSGTGISNLKNIEYNSTNFLPVNPTREGYQFGGWYTDSELNTKFEEQNMPAKDLVLYAKWIPNNYTVSFDSNGGNGTMESIDFEFATPQTLPSNKFERTGYTFAGWALEANGQVKFLNESSVNNLTSKQNGNVILYAIWNVNQYTITFEVDGKEIAILKQNYGTVVNAPNDPIKVGYTFTGWDGEIPATMPAENLLFVAQFSINQYTITFKVDGVVYHEITLNYNENVVAPDNPSKVGHTFVGWDTTIPSKIPANDMVINANFVTDAYKLTVLFNNGEEAYVEEVLYGSKPEYVLPLVAKEGYTFIGWSGSIPSSMPANDVTISANWKINQYTISFDSNGGNDVSDITQDYNTIVNTPINPNKEGHTFVGWLILNSESNQYEEFSFENLTMPSQNIELVANWNVNSYEFTVVYNNGTSKTDTFTYEFGAQVNPIEDPKYEGYAFDYWMCDGEVFSFQNYKMPAKDVTIIAIFENVYTISFVTNSSSVVSPISGIKDQDISSLIPSEPTKEGYEFNGWTILVDGNYVSYTLPSLMPGENLTLYADWSPITYNVVLDVDGQTSSLIATYNETLLVESPSKEGYTFAGWLYNSTIYFDEVFNLSNTQDDVVTLIAQWKTNSYTLTIDYQNEQEKTIETVLYGEKPTTLLVNPTKEGYTFAGWSGSIPASMPASDVVITANWTINTYKLTVLFNNGDEAYVEEVVYGMAPICVLPTVTKVGHTFAGWSGSIPSTMPANDVVINAIFDENHYSITFNSNEGMVVTPMDVIENIAFTEEFNLPLNGFRKDYYHFVGWSTVKNGSVEYTNEELVSGLTDKDEENVILYAVWEINTYSIVFNANGGEGVMKSQLFTCNSEQALSMNLFVKEGHSFVGWAITSEENAMKVYDDMAKITNLVEENGGAYHLYALWEANIYDVTYVHGYKDNITIKLTYDEMIDLSVESRVGYTFEGWYLDSKFSEESKVTSLNVPEGGITIYAKWSINYYSVTINLGKSHGYNETTLTSSPLLISYGTNLSEYLLENGYVLARTGNDLSILLNSLDITNTFDSYKVTCDIELSVSYKAKEYTIKFIIDDNLLFIGKYLYGSDLSYTKVKEDLTLTRNTLHELLVILRTFIVSEGKQGTDLFMAFAYVFDESGKMVVEPTGIPKASEKSLIINSLTVYNDPTYNLLVAYYNELFVNNSSHITQLYEFVALAEESFTRTMLTEPKLDGKIFTGWILGTETYYLDKLPGSAYLDCVPSGTNGVSNVVANFIDAPALDLSNDNITTNKDIETDKTTTTLTWENEWESFVNDYLVKYYGYKDENDSTQVNYEVSFVISNYNSVTQRKDELATTNSFAYTFMTTETYSIPGDYDIVVQAVVNVYGKDGKEIANFETSIGNTVRISLTPPVNSGNLTASDEYYYIFNDNGVYYLYIFTNSTYSFDTKLEFEDIINAKHSYNELITLNEIQYANGVTEFTTNDLSGDFKIYAPQSNGSVREYFVRVLPLVNKFTFADSLNDYKYSTNNLTSIDTYLDKDAKPYMIGNSVEGMTISEYKNNAVKLDIYTLTNTNKQVDKNLFAGYLNYTFFELGSDVPLTIGKIADGAFVEYNWDNDTFEFNGEVGRKYRLVIEFGDYCIPKALVNYIKPLELVFEINECINVYTHDVLQRVYANLNYQNGINIHSNIEAKLYDIDRYTEAAITGNPAFAVLATVTPEEHKMKKNNKNLDYTRYFTGHIPYAEYWQTKDSVPFDGSPINMVPWELHHLYTKAYFNYQDDIKNGNTEEYYNYIATFRTGNVYMRAGVVDPNYQEEYIVNGNYFEIDGSKLGYMSVNSIDNLSDIDGYLVPNGYCSFFSYYVHSNVTEYNSKMKTDYENAYSDNYAKNPVKLDESGNIISEAKNSTIIFNNITLQSNTSTTHEAGSDLTSSAIAMMNRNAGGYIGITAGFGCGLITNNTIIRGATLGVAARWESELTMNYTTILSSWANPVYLLDAGDVYINNSYIRDSGGSAIYVEDGESVITRVEKFVDANGKETTVPVYDGFVTDNSVNIDLYTKIENYVIGTEGYYNAYGMTTQVTALKGLLEPTLNNLPDNKLTSIERKENYLGQQVEMINFVYMACVAGKHGDNANSKNVLPICHTKLNIQSFVVSASGGGMSTVTQSGATHSHFGTQTVLRHVEQSGYFEGFLLLTYDIPGKGRSVLGLGVKPYSGQ